MPIFKRKIQCARRFNSRVCLYAFQIAMHYVIQFDGRGGGGYKPTQKWWLKLKLPIERTSAGAKGRRKAGREGERVREKGGYEEYGADRIWRTYSRGKNRFLSRW